MTNVTATTAEPAHDTVMVRLLRDCAYGEANAVVAIEKALLPTYVKDGLIDADLDNAEHAESGSIEPSELVKVRLLRESPLGEVGDVAFIDKKLVDGYTKGGLVDASPGAVAYAESLKNKE